MHTETIHIDSRTFPRVSEKLIGILDDSIISRDGPFSRIVPLDDSTDFLCLFRGVTECLQNLSGHLGPFHFMKPCRQRIGLVWPESCDLQMFGNSRPAHIMEKDSRDDDFLVAVYLF